MKRAFGARLATFLTLCLLLQTVPQARAQSKLDPDINAKIRKEESGNSQIMRTLHVLTDLYGPRLTGSPNLKGAGEWAVRQMTSWGFENAHLEPWSFGHPGWLNERASGFITEPVKDSLVFEVLAWTPSTNGAVTAQAFQMVPPENPTQETLNTYLAGVKDQVRRKIVLVGKQTVVPVLINTPPKRLSDEELRPRFDPTATPSPSPSPTPTPSPTPERLSGSKVNELVEQFLRENGALVRVNDAGREHGQIRAFNNRSFDVEKVLPTVVLRNEDYGRISRLLADGRSVTLEFNIQNRVFPEGTTSYNVVAEIPGTDKRDEVIMLGGHLDSWHAATGATDNAIGCAVMMEAARILKAVGVRPRRTIRVALWSGEEQGLLGSQAYVKEHFGSFENPRPDFFKLGGYFNIDSGTGRARGMSVFGPPEAANVLREAVGPFAYQGVIGAAPTRSRALGGSDNTSFNQAGLPGIGTLQDPIEYFTHTWHTNLDTYERVIEDDVKKSAMVIAAAVYQLAMRDELLPRFRREEMPPPPPSPSPSPSPTPTTTPRQS
ncbi:MAG TPA: M20/M25/M40 family metallo-hydrolase [Pyrinomonadaceae bacterium]|jgi:hypothetical protein